MELSASALPRYSLAFTYSLLLWLTRVMKDVTITGFWILHIGSASIVVVHNCTGAWARYFVELRSHGLDNRQQGDVSVS